MTTNVTLFTLLNFDNNVFPQASKASVLMYRYNLHSEDANDDLKRTLAQGSYQLVHKWDLSVHAQNVCAVNCINSTPSPLIFCATSDK